MSCVPTQHKGNKAITTNGVIAVVEHNANREQGWEPNIEQKWNQDSWNAKREPKLIDIEPMRDTAIEETDIREHQSNNRMAKKSKEKYYEAS